MHSNNILCMLILFWETRGSQTRWPMNFICTSQLWRVSNLADHHCQDLFALFSRREPAGVTLSSYNALISLLAWINVNKTHPFKWIGSDESAVSPWLRWQLQMHNLVCIIGVYKPVEICKLGSFQAELTLKEGKKEKAAEKSENKLFYNLWYHTHTRTALRRGSPLKVQPSKDN